MTDRVHNGYFLPHDQSSLIEATSKIQISGMLWMDSIRCGSRWAGPRPIILRANLTCNSRSVDKIETYCRKSITQHGKHGCS